ncbi:uncharacterized membrane protein YsdA (DUF1294 family) [Deinococcus metalli]|uniref:Uncharacterized membrane protein YsdA (DUF1294 family) n=1 Tax=Deinococcus metalli TaxID=1141878 RepID=A0A7W8NQ84_9DEIO|nr:DUF1294 domain-containing protein [Deinococcus metalli]MBB5375588.1 uncharacterized membrane protein YsdA (DUF1294 family) [Deinococcus metalli]GHF28145.1 hypothetical protein GCM10017781_00070 [Deinococcus metalli]
MILSPAAWAAFDAVLRVFVAWQVVWGLIAFVSVWRDKVLASGGRRRVPERTLHRTEAWGGWLGSFVAQRVFRHKTRKAPYQRAFLRIAACWLGAWGAVIGLRLLAN